MIYDDHDDERHSGGYDRGSSEDYNRYQQSSQNPSYGQRTTSSTTNGRKTGSDNGYSVASTHDYLGYRHDEKPFGEGSMWDDGDKGKTEELW
jgi:hypothetical protein